MVPVSSEQMPISPDVETNINAEESVADQVYGDIEKPNSQTDDAEIQVVPPVVYILATISASRIAYVAARCTAHLKMRSHTAGNWAHNLSVATRGKPIGEFDGHHNLAKKFASDFHKAGLNCHDPKFGTWVKSDYHKKFSNAYNMGKLF